MNQLGSEGDSGLSSLRLDPTADLDSFLAKCVIEAEPNRKKSGALARGKAFGLSALVQAMLLVVLLIVPPPPYLP